MVDCISRLDVKDATLPVIRVKRSSKRFSYPELGFGDEGIVFKYNDNIAFKTFELSNKMEKLREKYLKVAALSHITGPDFCFAHGYVAYDDDEYISGIYMDLIKPYEEIKDLWHLRGYRYFDVMLKILINVSNSIAEIHQKGVIIGDLKGSNIIVDEKLHHHFVDTDNYAYGDYDFDSKIARLGWLSSIYHHKFSLIDNDKYLLGIIAMQCFIPNILFREYQSDEFFKEMIKLIHVPYEVKWCLREIFSDTKDKPYVGDILKNIDPNSRVYTVGDLQRLRRMRQFNLLID